MKETRTVAVNYRRDGTRTLTASGSHRGHQGPHLHASCPGGGVDWTSDPTWDAARYSVTLPAGFERIRCAGSECSINEPNWPPEAATAISVCTEFSHDCVGENGCTDGSFSPMALSFGLGTKDSHQSLSTGGSAATETQGQNWSDYSGPATATRTWALRLERVD